MSENRFNPLLIWIHCNRCVEIMVKKRKRFGLLSCQHVFCESCIEKFTANDKKTCPFCKKIVGVMEINSSTPIKYRRYFQPQPWTNIANFADVVPFQIKHRNHLLNLLKKPILYKVKLNNLKKELQERCEKLKNKQKQTIIYRNQLKNVIEKFKMELRNNNKSFTGNLSANIHLGSTLRAPGQSKLIDETFTYKNYENKPDTSNRGYHSNNTQFLQGDDFSFF